MGGKLPTEKATNGSPADRLITIAEKFGIDRSYFITYYVGAGGYDRKVAQTKVRRIYDGSYPRDDKHLVEATSARIPYGFTIQEVQNYLRGTEPSESDSLGQRIKRIEGAYELVRYHSTENALVQEYFEIDSGRIMYRNYNDDGTSTHFHGPISSFANHFQFTGQEVGGVQKVFGTFERSAFRKNFYAGLLVGVSDDRLDIICCKTLARKLRIKKGAAPKPGRAHFSKVRMKRYEMLSVFSEGHDQNDHFVAFSSGVIRKQQRASRT